MFEVNNTGQWAETNFSDVIEELDEAGFTCFWAGAHGLLRLTGCYHPIFDTEGIADATTPSARHAFCAIPDAAPRTAAPRGKADDRLRGRCSGLGFEKPGYPVRALPRVGGEERKPAAG